MRIDDRKRTSHQPTETAPVPGHIRQLQQQLAGLRETRRDPAVKADDALLQTSRLFIALSRMNLACTQQEAIATVSEILVNFIGTERFVCLVFGKDRKQLRCLFSMGVDDEQIAELESASEEMRAALRGGTWIGINSQAGRDWAEPVAIVPLKLKDESFGLILILGLLPQKSGLERADYALCDLLSNHAAACISRSASTAGERRNDS